MRVVVVGREEGGRGGEKRDFMALSPNTSFHQRDADHHFLGLPATNVLVITQ